MKPLHLNANEAGAVRAYVVTRYQRSGMTRPGTDMPQVLAIEWHGVLVCWWAQSYSSAQCALYCRPHLFRDLVI
jgi:hypothetical protein